MGSALASVFLGIAAIAYLLSSDETPPLQPAAPVTAQTAPPAPSNPSAATIASSEPSAAQVVDDPSGQLLWAPPTDGAPISLAYVPAGTQCLLHVRPASVANGPEGERLIAALGPWGRSTVDRLRAILGSDWTEIESLLVAVTVNDDHQLEATLRAEFATPLDGAALAGRFPAARRTELAGLTMYTQDGRAYFVAQGPAPVLVVTSVALAAELIESAGDAPPLVRDIEALVEHTDADRDVTLIVAPKFLQASGHELLAAAAAPLHDGLRWLLGDEATAIALSVDWGDNFFAELRATPALNIPPRRLAAKLRDRVAAMPAAVEEMVLAEPWHVYGRKVIARLPGMLRTLARYTRAGDEDGEAIVRSYLPAAAGHNLLMAGELLLTQPHGDGAEHSAPNDAGPPLRVSVAEKLAAKTSLSFTKESLEQALALLAEDVGVEIVIAGGDLQLDGITKNQSLGLDLRDRPASEILLEILLRANPDRQATGPGDPRQKLVYVIEPTTTGAAERIIVTTRTAAAKRGDQLPEPFRAASR
ncbi:MAG: hypothetical protein JNL18_07880 [Planctomycetaceae bacterium]|nr:hypothetical protein [Planctomycetaceae bacterium]